MCASLRQHRGAQGEIGLDRNGNFFDEHPGSDSNTEGYFRPSPQVIAYRVHAGALEGDEMHGHGTRELL
jgi:hypothetical protein